MDTLKDIAARLQDAVIDWDGSRMDDGTEPRVIPTCGELREAVERIAELTRERDELAKERGGLLQRVLDLEVTVRSLIARYEHDGIPNDSLPVVEAARALIAFKGTT